MKKLITLALVAGLLTSCEEQTTVEKTSGEIGTLYTLSDSSARGTVDVEKHKITDYMYTTGYAVCTTLDGQTIITSNYTIILNEKH